MKAVPELNILPTLMSNCHKPNGTILNFAVVVFFFLFHKLLHPIDWWSNTLCLREWLEFPLIHFVNTVIALNRVSPLLNIIELQKHTSIIRRERKIFCHFVYFQWVHMSHFFPYKSKSFSLLSARLLHKNSYSIDSMTDQPIDQKIQSAYIVHKHMEL